MVSFFLVLYVFFFKQKTAYEMRISDWSSDVCSSDLSQPRRALPLVRLDARRPARSADGAARRRDAADAQRRPVEARAALTWGGGVPGCEGKGGNREQGMGHVAGAVLQRSEERRVGKGWVIKCRTRWATSHSKKKT